METAATCERATQELPPHVQQQIETTYNTILGNVAELERVVGVFKTEYNNAQASRLRDLTDRALLQTIYTLPVHAINFVTSRLRG